MNILMTILYILLFIFCLSMLIVIHELGHFTAAKIFNVYVLEYSIGFGPALIHKKRKNGETYFSLRVIPFGGYVSMFGEETVLEEGEEIPQKRSLEGIAKWKRAIILVAGVTMNALLALTLFFINNVGFEQKTLYTRNMTIAEGSKADLAGLKTLDVLAIDSEIDEDTDSWYNSENKNMHLLDNAALVTFSDTSTEYVYAFLDTTNVKNFVDISISDYITLYSYSTSGTIKYDITKQISYNVNFKSVNINFQVLDEYEVDKNNNIISSTIVKSSHPIEIERTDEGKLEDFGYSFYLQINKRLSFFKAIGQSFVDFGNSSMMIGKALGTLFTKETWNSLGGIIAIGYESTSTLQNLGFGYYLYLWGALSVNLAIINLLPFPGLDGWQLLVLAVEAIFRKKIPNKVKTIVSIVGLALLFTFMIVILVKDFLFYVIKI